MDTVSSFLLEFSSFSELFTDCMLKIVTMPGVYVTFLIYAMLPGVLGFCYSLSSFY